MFEPVGHQSAVGQHGAEVWPDARLPSQEKYQVLPRVVRRNVLRAPSGAVHETLGSLDRGAKPHSMLKSVVPGRWRLKASELIQHGLGLLRAESPNRAP